MGEGTKETQAQVGRARPCSDPPPIRSLTASFTAETPPLHHASCPLHAGPADPVHGRVQGRGQKGPRHTGRTLSPSPQSCRLCAFLLGRRELPTR